MSAKGKPPVIDPNRVYTSEEADRLGEQLEASGAPYELAMKRVGGGPGERSAHLYRLELIDEAPPPRGGWKSRQRLPTGPLPTGPLPAAQTRSAAPAPPQRTYTNEEVEAACKRLDAAEESRRLMMQRVLDRTAAAIAAREERERPVPDGFVRTDTGELIPWHCFQC